MKGAHFEDIQRKIEMGNTQKLLFTMCSHSLPEKVVCSKSTLQFKIEYNKSWGV